MLLVIVLVGFLGLSLAFPAAVQAGQAKTEVRWFQWKTTEVGEKLMNELKAAFEKEHPDITLTLVDNPFQGFHDKALTLFQAQKLADVLMVQVDWVAEFATWGCWNRWTALAPRRLQGVHGNISGLPARSGRGKQYYHRSLGCVALFWNTEIFKKAGIAGPPKTWDEYVQIAKKVTNPEKKIFATTATLQIEPPTNMTYDIYPLILQAGGGILDTKVNKAAFNSPAGVKAIEWYVDLVNKHKVAVPGVLSNGEKEKRANFATGNIAMMFEGPWGVAIQKNLNKDLVRHRDSPTHDRVRDRSIR
jgi:ABC-type glycerol-3-phosphate transport system substrate-binding protein